MKKKTKNKQKRVSVSVWQKSLFEGPYIARDCDSSQKFFTKCFNLNKNRFHRNCLMTTLSCRNSFNQVVNALGNENKPLHAFCLISSTFTSNTRLKMAKTLLFENYSFFSFMLSSKTNEIF